MVFEHIEKLKREYTDKYVAVDASRPDLKRFADNVGVVRTVNMSGRALVEFPGYHKNIGWYDIDVDFLKIVDKPPETTEAKKPAAKQPAAAKSAPTTAPAKKQPAAAAGGKKLSVAEMLAAARGEKKGGETAKAAPSEAKAAPKKEAPATAPAAPTASIDRSKMSVTDILAAARAEKQGGAAKAGAAVAKAPPKPAESAAKESPRPISEPQANVDRSKMSVADILAAARAEKQPASPAAQPVDDAPAEEAAAPSPPAEEPVVKAAPVKPPSGEKVDRDSMSVEEIIAWCRAHDAAG